MASRIKFAIGAVVVFTALAFVGAACGNDNEPTTEPTQDTEAADADVQTCSVFREVADGAESMTEDEVAVRLEEVGTLAETASDSGIHDAGVKVGLESDVQSLISGDADPAQDALSAACDRLFPI